MSDDFITVTNNENPPINLEITTYTNESGVIFIQSKGDEGPIGPQGIQGEKGDIGVSTLLMSSYMGDIDSSNTTFVIDDTYDDVIIYLNGVKYSGVVDYIYTQSTKTIVFNTAPVTGYLLEIYGITNKNAEVVPLEDLAIVAETGSYNDLGDKPSIPEQLSDLSDDSMHRLVTDTEMNTWNAKQDAGDYATTEDLTEGLADKVDKVSGKALSTNDLTDALKSNYDTAYTNNHTHLNKTILDNATASFTAEEAAYLSNQSGTNTGDETNESIITKLGYIPASAQAQDRIYDGIDLSVKFETEIAASPYNGDVWSWIKARIQAENFTDIHIGDYIPFSLSAGIVTDGTTPYTFSAQNFKAQIAGINTYKGYGNTEIVSHIDFITKTLINTPIPWQLSDNNNGTADSASPWLSSKLRAVLNGINNYTTNAYNSIPHGYNASGGGVLQLLPSGLQNAIISKIQYAETKYSSSGLATASTASNWFNFDKLWLPNEFEISGAMLFSHTLANCNAVQYPIYTEKLNRVKTNSSGIRQAWWLSSTHNGFSTTCCYSQSYGSLNAITCSNTGIYSPICFRIG